MDHKPLSAAVFALLVGSTGVVGQDFYFMSNTPSDPTDFDIYHYGNGSVSPAQRWAGTVEEHPTLSPDGLCLAFVSDLTGHDAVWLKDLTTGGVRLFAEEADHPFWHPNGTSLYVTVKHTEIRRIDLTGNVLGSLSFAGAQTGHSPTYVDPLTNQVTVLFSSDRDGDFDIYSCDENLQNWAPLTANGDYDAGAVPIVSGSSVTIAFSTDRQAGDDCSTDVFTMDGDGNNQSLLLQSTGGLRWPYSSYQSAGGPVVLYSAQAAGTWGVYGIPLTGGGPSGLQVGGVDNMFQTLSAVCGGSSDAIEVSADPTHGCPILSVTHTADPKSLNIVSWEWHFAGAVVNGGASQAWSYGSGVHEAWVVGTDNCNQEHTSNKIVIEVGCGGPQCYSGLCSPRFPTLPLQPVTFEQQHFGVADAGKTRFLSATTLGSHFLVELDRDGNYLGGVGQPIPFGQPGLRDLSYDGGRYVYGLANDPWIGSDVVYAFDTLSHQWDLGVFSILPLQGSGALAYDPTGGGGAGSFWTSDGFGNVVEVGWGGSILHVFNSGIPNITGAARDPVAGTIWLYSRGGPGHPTSQTVATEYDPGTDSFTGKTCAGPAGQSQGLGFTHTLGKPTLLCLSSGAPVPGGDALDEVSVDFTFGHGCPDSTGDHPEIGLAGTAPHVGNPAFGITYDGAAGLALFMLGIDRETFGPFSLPHEITPGCLLEIDPVVTTFVPANSGTAAYMLGIPNHPSFAGFELKAQWGILDALAPNGVGAVTPGGQFQIIL